MSYTLANFNSECVCVAVSAVRKCECDLRWSTHDLSASNASVWPISLREPVSTGNIPMSENRVRWETFVETKGIEHHAR